MNGLPGGGAPQASAGIDRNDPMVKGMNALMESCFGKSAISGAMGFAMGGVFGMFMASMSYDTPYHTPGAPGPVGPNGQPLSALPMRRQLAVGLKDMGTRSYSMAKNFGVVGAMFSGIECGIEGFRAKNDLANGIAAGCLTGGILARGGGPIAVGGGCAAFAAFSAAIDAYMRSPGDE